MFITCPSRLAHRWTLLAALKGLSFPQVMFCGKLRDEGSQQLQFRPQEPKLPRKHCSQKQSQCECPALIDVKMLYHSRCKQGQLNTQTFNVELYVFIHSDLYFLHQKKSLILTRSPCVRWAVVKLNPKQFLVNYSVVLCNMWMSSSGSSTSKKPVGSLRRTCRGWLWNFSKVLSDSRQIARLGACPWTLVSVWSTNPEHSPDWFTLLIKDMMIMASHLQAWERLCTL